MERQMISYSNVYWFAATARAAQVGVVISNFQSGEGEGKFDVLRSLQSVMLPNKCHIKQARRGGIHMSVFSVVRAFLQSAFAQMLLRLTSIDQEKVLPLSRFARGAAIRPFVA